MLFNRLVKYESSAGGVSFEAIQSQHGGKSSFNFAQIQFSLLYTFSFQKKALTN